MGIIFFYFYPMQMENYISDLLYRYECVTVPGLGSFLAHAMPASYDGDSHQFFPPGKRVSFNVQIKENDGLLANYISKAKMISYEDALTQIKAYARYVLFELETGNEVKIDKIGVLSRPAQNAVVAEGQEEGKILFEPEKGINYLAESFGLSATGAGPIVRAALKEQGVTEPEKAPISLIGKKRISQEWMKYAAIGFLAVGLSGTLGYLHLERVESYNVAEKQKAEKKLENKIQHATFVIDNPLPTIKLNAFKPHGKYHLVAGAFRNAENAEKRVGQLREKGYRARQIGANRFGLYQVVYDSYTDPKEALISLRKVRKNDNRSAWMLVKKLDK